MVRNICVAVCGLALGTSAALGQLPGPMPPYGNPGMPGQLPGPMPPYGNPGMPGYPGYPAPGYGSPLPMGPAGPLPPGAGMPPPGAGMPMPMPSGAGVPMPPWGNPTAMPFAPMPQPAPFVGGMPMPPYGNQLAVPAPPDPRRPMMLPTFDGAGPRPGASEPYVVGPDKSPTAKGPMPVLPSPLVEKGPVAVDPAVCPAAAYGVPMPPSEPYTLYEGPRYLADVKVENTCVFGDVAFIHWWTRHDQTPTLLTTGNPASANPGALNTPGTTALLGGPIDPNEFSGVQANFGIWLDSDHLTSLEVGAFYLGRNSRQYSFSSNAAGSPLIAQPVALSGPTGFSETAFTIANPGLLAGSAAVTSTMDMFGAEFNFGQNLFRLNGWSFDFLAGFRYMYLNDTLTSTQSSTILPAAAGAINFLGVPQSAGANLLFNDSYNLTNRFYGGQIGGRLDWVTCYGLDFGAIVKIAFGDTVHTGNVDGSTTLTNGGVSTTAPGGAYALPSAIGLHQSGDFSAVTEINLTVGYQIHPNIRLFAGYDLIYWPRVERAGEQIDHMQDVGQSPTAPAFTGVGSYPRFLNVKNDFWAQGINLGVELKY